MLDIKVLVKKAQANDKDAFEILIKNYSEKLFGIAKFYMKEDDKALDMLQETILCAFKNINKLKNSEYFNTWIAKILINLCKKSLLQSHNDLSFENFENSVLATVEADEFLKIDSKIDIENALKKLDSKSYEIIMYKFFMDYSINEIAEMLSCPIGTVKSRIHYALKKLSIYLTEE